MSQEASRNLLGAIDGLVLLAYMLMLVYMGYKFSRRQTSAEHYFTASGKIPGWAMGISMFAAILSSFTFVAFPGYAYDTNWEVFMRELTTPLVIVICIIIVIPIYRNAIRMTAYEYLERRFGPIARFYGTFNFLIGHITKMGVVMYIMCLSLGSVTGWPLTSILIVMGIVTIAYTLVDGIEGVVWTDVVQGLLMIGSGLVSVGFLLFLATPHGPGDIMQMALSHDKFRMVNLKFSWTQQSSWIFIYFGILQYLGKWGTDQTVVQRYIIAPSVKEAIKGTVISILCCLVAWSTFLLIGTLLWSFYQINPHRLAADITKGDQVFPYFIAHELPVGLRGLILAGLFACSMSVLSSDLNAVGSCFISDVYDRFFKRSSAKMRLVISKLVILFCGLLMILLGFAVGLWKGGMVDFSITLGSIVGSVIGGGGLSLFFLGFMTRRVTKKGLYTALVVGVLFSVWALGTKYNWRFFDFLPSQLRYNIHLWWMLGLSNVLVFVVAYVASWILEPGKLAPLELTIYGYDLFRGGAKRESVANAKPEEVTTSVK